MTPAKQTRTIKPEIEYQGMRNHATYPYPAFGAPRHGMYVLGVR